MTKLKDIPGVDNLKKKPAQKEISSLRYKNFFNKHSKKETLDLVREEIIKKFISEIELIKSPTTQGDAFVYSNDTEVAKNMPEIIKSVDNAKALFKVAVIIGSGPLWNIPKEFEGIDLVLSLDINSNQLELNRQRASEIMSAQGPDDLLPKPNNAIDAKDFIAIKKERDRINAPKIEADSYSFYHYLSSMEKLRKTQFFIEKNKIAYVGGDISDHDFTKKLGDILKKYKADVVFMDLTNVLEWVAGSPGHVKQEAKDNYLKSLGNLPLIENCPILHSHHIGRAGRSPIVAQLNFGLENYN
ncbi:MAG: hypothetical protein PHG49_03905 [Candidatus Pacebacteria bacterium]|nr:hypothetical protein [Candidatus Paceibacterota bacterium]